MISFNALSGKSLIRNVILVFFLLAAFGQWHEARAQAADSTQNIEKEVKAAYLYKFASYIEWPEGTFSSAENPVVVGVIGADALGDELQRIVVGRTSNGRALVVKKLRRGDSIAGIHILFIGALEKEFLIEILNTAKGQPVLTVSESDQAYALGSMINFRVAEAKMRFEVALKPVVSSHLKISARMLAVAYKVVQATS